MLGVPFRGLKRQETQARIDKLRSERGLVELQLTPSYQRREILKAVSGIGGTLAGFAAIATLFFSVVTASNELSQDREVRIEERFDTALRLTASESVRGRLSGVISLGSFLEAFNIDRQKRTLLLLVHSLSVEKDATVRSAITHVFRDIDTSIVSLDVVDRATVALIRSSRSIVVQNRLNRYGAYKRDFLARGIADSIVSMISLGTRIRDFSGIYCPRCDFAGKELNGAIFDGAILERADFSMASLNGASFDRADLNSTRFRRAKLRNARLTISKTKQVGLFSTEYSWDKLSHDLHRVGMPDFNCADLTGADFTGRVVFGIIHKDANLIYYSNFKATSFRNAILNGANLENIGVYGVGRHSDMPSLPFTTSKSVSSGFHKSKESKTYWTFKYFLDEHSALTSNTLGYKKNMDAFAWSFAGSDWQAAKLPPALRSYIQEFADSVGEFRAYEEFWCDSSSTIR